MLVKLPSGAIAEVLRVCENQSPKYSRIKDGCIRCRVKVTQARRHNKKGDVTYFDVPAEDVNRWQKQKEESQ